MRLVIALAFAAALGRAAAAEPQPPAARDSTGGTDPVYEQLLRDLRARTDSTLTREATVFDAAYRDSAVAVLDSTISANGLAAALGRYTDEGPLMGSPRAARGTRFWIGAQPENPTLRYSKVDGGTLLVPVQARLSSGALSLTTSARAGYAFGSAQGRGEAEVRLVVGGNAIGATARRSSERFGRTLVHGGDVAALFGNDEQQYLERLGWGAFASRTIVEGATLTADYRRERQRPLRARDVFAIGGAAAPSEQNRQATRGDLRALRVTLARERAHLNGVWGDLFAETTGGGLGGDLEFDRVGGDVVWRPFLPWGGEIELNLAGQAAASSSWVPAQALGDVAGRSGVRGYPQLSIVGTHALLARLDVLVGLDLFRRMHVPFLRHRRLQLIPFVDVGAAWTPRDLSSLAASTLPAARDWKWSAGLGIRKALGFGKVLSHARVNAAWRLDRAEHTPVLYFVLEGEPFN